MTFLKRTYHVLLPLSVLLLGYLLYSEYQTREIAVTGARLDHVGSQLWQAELMANVTKNQDVLKILNGKDNSQFPCARDYFGMAIQAYRKKDFRVARIHIHNTMHELEIATTLLINSSKETQSP